MCSWGASNLKTTTYPAKLQQYLDNNPTLAKDNITCVVNNFGVSGTTALKDGDHPYWATKPYQSAIAFQADYIVIQFGTNDAKVINWNETAYVKDFVELINSFKQSKKKPAIFISSPPPY